MPALRGGQRHRAPADAGAEPGAVALPFYGYDPRAVITAGMAPPKRFDILHVGHNWWRWRELSTELLPAIARARGARLHRLVVERRPAVHAPPPAGLPRGARTRAPSANPGPAGRALHERHAGDERGADQHHDPAAPVPPSVMFTSKYFEIFTADNCSYCSIPSRGERPGRARARPRRRDREEAARRDLPARPLPGDRRGGSRAPHPEPLVRAARGAPRDHPAMSAPCA